MATINAISVALFNAAAGGYASEMAANGAAFANAVGPVLQKDVSTDALFVDHLLGNLGVTSSSSVYAQAKAAVTALVTTKGRLSAAVDAIDFLKAQEGTTNPYATIAANFAAKVNSAALFTAANPNERDITRLISSVTGIDTDVVAINNAVAAQKAADDANAAKAAADAAAALKAANDKATADLTAAKAAADKAAADAATALKAAQEKAAADLTVANKLAADAATKAAADAKTAADKAAADAATALKAAQDKAAADLKAAQEKGAADAVAAVTKALKDAAAASGVVGYETMTDSQLVAAIKTSDNAAVAKAVDITTDNAVAITKALKDAAVDLGVLNTSTMTNAQLLNAIAASNDAIVAQNAAQAQKALDDKALAAVDNTSFSSEQSAYDAAKALGDATAKALQAKIDALQAQVDASKAITYAVTATATSVNEGATATFIIQTTGLADGASLSYTIQDSVSTAGRVATTSGTAKVDSSGVALVTVPVAANNQTDGTGKLTLSLINGKASNTIDIADTSKTQTTWNISATDIATANLQNSPIAVTVGNSGAQTVNLATDAVTATRGFTITGNGDITVNSTLSNDTITVSGNGNNTINAGAGNDTIVVSGTGSNTINVGAGTDTVTGGAGNDTIVMGSGALDSTDRIAGGDGTDTLVISGTGNELTSANVTGVENLVLNGTTLTISSLTALQALKSIQGSSTTSEITVTVANNDVVDLTGLSLTTIKSINLSGSGTVTIKADGADLTAVGAFLKTGATTVNLSTDINGFKALSSADTGINGTKTVTASASEIIANKAALTGAALVVSGSITGADVLALANAGITTTKTVSMSVAELLTAAQYPDQLAALTAANTLIAVTGNATVAQAVTLISTYGTQITAYQAAATGNKGIAISDTPAAVAAAYNTTANHANVSSLALTDGAAITESNAANLVTLTYTGSFSVKDSASAINSAITSSTSLPNSLSKASSVELTSAARTVSTADNALELKQLGTKLVGGFDYADSVTNATGTNGLLATAAATKVTLTGTATVSQLNNLLSLNSKTTVAAVSDTAANLTAWSSNLSAVNLDLVIQGALTVSQAATLSPVLTAITAKTGAHASTTLSTDVSAGTYTNKYVISDVATAIVDPANAAVVKGASKVTSSDAMTLSQANTLQALAAVTGDALTAGSTTLVYNVTDSASALAAGLGATSNTATVGALAGAITVTASGTATIAEAKLLGGTYNTAVQVDTWAISADKSTVFSSGSTLSTDIDQTTDAALLGATSFAVTGGSLTIAQVNALKGIQTGITGNAKIFNNVYTVSDTAANIAAAISDTTVSGSTTVGALNIAALNAAGSVTVTGNATAAQATQLKAATTFTNWSGAYSIVDTYSALSTVKTASPTTYNAAATVTVQDTVANVNANYAWINANTNGYNVSDNLTNLISSASAVIVGNAKAVSIPTATVSIAGLTLTSGAATASCTANTNLVAGMSITGTGIPAGATILSVQSPSAFTLSANATATASGSYTAGSGDAGAASINATSATSLYNANRSAVYTVSDTAANLVSAAGSPTTKVGAANASSVTVSDATTVANVKTILGVNAKSTYSLADTYTNVAAQASIADGASAINVSNSSLTVDQYANLLAIAGATKTVTTTVSAEAIADKAANVNAASAEVLGAASAVTLTDVGALSLTAAQARGLFDGSTAWKLAAYGSQPGGVAATVKIVDTTANLLAAKADGALSVGSATSTTTANAFVLNSSNQISVKASDVATLTGAQMTSLLGISNISAGYNLSDTAGNLTSGSTGSKVIVTGVANAGSVTVTSSSGNLTTAEMAKVIFTANSKVTFAAVTDTAANIGSYASDAYTYAPSLAKASSIVVGSTESVSDVKAAKAAAGTVTLTYGLSDTAANLVGTDGSALLPGATALVIASSGVATAKQAETLVSYISKFASSGFGVTDTAANLVGALNSVKAAKGTVTLASGETATVSQFQTLKGTLGTSLATTNITDTAAKIADFLIAGSTTGAGTLTLSTSDYAVNAAQVAALASSTITSSNMEVTDTAANLLALADNSVGKSFSVKGGPVDIATAKQLMVLFETGAKFDLATTSDRFVAAYADTTNTNTITYNDVNQKVVLQQATTITVDGTAVTLGSSDKAFATLQPTHVGKIIGTAEQIKALPSALKTAAGYVVVDSVANITSAANAALVAAGSGYVINDNVANILAAAPATLAGASGALAIEVKDATSVANITTISGVNSNVSYSLKDNVTNLSAVTGSTGILFKATAVEVTSTATATQASTLLNSLTGNPTAKINVVDTGANLANTSTISAANLKKLVSIVADADLTTAGNQGITAAEANAVLSNKASTATFTFNVVDSASNLSTAVANTSSTGANLANLSSAGTVGVTVTAATAAEAKNLAKLTITGDYTVTDTAANLTTSTTVGLSDLDKAKTVKVTSGTSGTAATYAQAVTLEGLAKMEKDSNGKYAFSIADSAKKLATASASVLDAIGGTVTVSYSNVADVLTAGEATSLRAVDAASAVMSVTGTSLVIQDLAANILDTVNASAVAASRSITVSDTISAATLASIKTAGGTSDSEVYTYKLEDSAANLLAAGTAVIDGATSVKVTGTTSVGYSNYIDSLKDASVANSTSVKFDLVSGTANQLFGSVSSGILTESSLSTTVNSVVAANANAIKLTDATSVARAAVLKGVAAFDGVYAVKDTASNLVTAINGTNKTVLDSATSVSLSSGQTALVAEAVVINSQLANESALALKDAAIALNATSAASIVSAAASVVVDMGTGSDKLSASTNAKVTYLVDSLNDMIQGSTNTLDILTLKTGDTISLTTADFDSVANLTQSFVKANDGSLSTPTVGSYDFVRGFLNGGVFVANEFGSDSQLIIHTSATTSTGDYIIALVGVTSLSAVFASGSTTNIIGFTL